jgi:hypothetical protein
MFTHVCHLAPRPARLCASDSPKLAPGQGTARCLMYLISEIGHGRYEYTELAGRSGPESASTWRIRNLKIYQRSLDSRHRRMERKRPTFARVADHRHVSVRKARCASRQDYSIEVNHTHSYLAATKFGNHLFKIRDHRGHDAPSGMFCGGRGE